MAGAMNILLSLGMPLSRDSGAAGATLRLADAYRRLGHRVEVFSTDALPRRIPAVLHPFVHPLALAAHLQRSRRVWDVVDAYTGDGAVAALLPRRHRLVCRSHGLTALAVAVLREEARHGRLRFVRMSWRYRLHHRAICALQARAARGADLVLLLNSEETRYAVERMRVDADRVQAITNGIPAELAGIAMEATPPPGAPLRLAMVAAYHSRKGVTYAVAALHGLLRRHPDMEVSLLGTGVDAAVVLADFDAPLRDRVHVVPHFANAELSSLLRGHHVLLFPTLWEGFSVALLEGMACGLAPVTTTVPGPADLVRDGVDGLLVPPRDAAAIERAVDTLVADRDLLHRLRAAAHATAQQHTWDEVARTTLRLYEGAAPRRGRVAIEAAP
jgi:glycosyltransferase involved in cell wall biosynthesis